MFRIEHQTNTTDAAVEIRDRPPSSSCPEFHRYIEDENQSNRQRVGDLERFVRLVQIPS